MPTENLKLGLRLALRLHEIGDASPYRLFFAGKGTSGASFGFMQGDLNGGQKEVTETFRKAMSAAGMSPAAIDSLLTRLAVHLITNPLSPLETEQVNAALLASRKLVDEMDERILQNVYAHLDRCVVTAQQAGREIAPKAQIYMALWINMTGPPTKLLIWLGGGDPGLQTPLPKLKNTVEGLDMERYLRATSYYIENPGNLPHMLQCAAAGVAILGTARPAPVTMAVTTPFASGRAIRAAKLTEAASVLTRVGATADDRLAEQRIGRELLEDSGEFASMEIESAFTSSMDWLRAPLTSDLLNVYFAHAAVDEFDFAGFTQHLVSLGLAHFQPVELLYLGSSNAAGNCKGTNTLPPKELWKNIDSTARMLDRIRELLGSPIRILSAYRAPKYNACIGGEKDSQHSRFNAIDWTCELGDVSEWHAVARKVRSERSEFLGGIGVYPRQRFIHVDTRGSDANWSGAS